LFKKVGFGKFKVKVYALPKGSKRAPATLMAKALANESGLNFLSVKGPEVLTPRLSAL